MQLNICFIIVLICSLIVNIDSTGLCLPQNVFFPFQDTILTTDSTSIKEEEEMPTYNNFPSAHFFADTAILADFDKIIRTDSTVINVRVNRISETDVFYVYPLNSEELSIPRKKVYQVIYSFGKREKFYALENEIDEDNIKEWESIKILEDLSQTDTLDEISEITALYESPKMKVSSEKLERNVLIIIKKKTLNAGGDYVLITDRKISKAYGDLPSIEIYGKAYKRK